MKTMAAVKSDRYVLIRLARGGVYSGPEFVGKRIFGARKAVCTVCGGKAMR
jgi:hypothetical protein